MKKLLFGALFSLLVLPLNLFALYTPTTQDNSLAELFANKINELSASRGENFKTTIVNMLNTFVKKYSATNPKYTYIFQTVLTQINASSTTQTEQENHIDIPTSNDICNLSLAQITKDYDKSTIIVSNEQELTDAINQARIRSNTTYYDIVLKKGVYEISNGFRIDVPYLIIRGETGNPADVVIKGKGMNGSVTHNFRVLADNIMIGDMTIGYVSNHPIQVHGEQDADNFMLHNAIIIDGKEQLLKGSFDSKNLSNRSNNSTIQCSVFKYSKGIGEQYYMGGIDVHYGKDWIVQYNQFEGIRSPEDNLSEHAIHFWSNSEGTIVRNNTIKNCDRGIGFGLGSSGHGSGLIENNIITHDTSRGDVGIGLENAHDVIISNNTIQFENNYQNAIEYRFAGTYNVKIIGTKTNKTIKARDGGNAEIIE